MILNDVLIHGIKTLRDGGIDGPQRDARVLLAGAVGLDVSRITVEAERIVIENDYETYLAMIDRRIAREPVARILGARVFWGRDFIVTPDVLDPRPETETLISAALEYGPADRLLDLGTGSGIIAVTLLAEWPKACAIATDISEEALAVCAKNSDRHRVGSRLEMLVSDWYSQTNGRFDLIVSNPPYIAQVEMQDLSDEVRKFDPLIALSPGGDGLDPYRTIAAGAMAHLTPKGRILVEIGPTQGDAVVTLFRDTGLVDCAILPDMDGRARVVAANMPRS